MHRKAAGREGKFMHIPLCQLSGDKKGKYKIISLSGRFLSVGNFLISWVSILITVYATKKGKIFKRFQQPIIFIIF